MIRESVVFNDMLMLTQVVMGNALENFVCVAGLCPPFWWRLPVSQFSTTFFSDKLMPTHRWWVQADVLKKKKYTQFYFGHVCPGCFLFPSRSPVFLNVCLIVLLTWRHHSAFYFYTTDLQLQSSRSGLLRNWAVIVTVRWLELYWGKKKREKKKKKSKHE